MATRRRFPLEFKARVVLELISGAKSLAEVCRQHQLNSQMVTRWKSEFLEKAPQVFQSQEHNSQAQARMAELERLIGRLSLELEIAKKALAMLNGHRSKSEGWS